MCIRDRDVDPTLVAGGIKVALLTTATGLLIAIPVNIGYNFFETRIDELIMQMEQGAQKVLDMAYTHGSSPSAFSAQEVSSNFGAE